jgi:hypothetical protein
VLGDALLLSGSLAAVAGAVFFLSERTRAAAATAAILPSAMAALASFRIGNRMKTSAESAQFQVSVFPLLRSRSRSRMEPHQSLTALRAGNVKQGDSGSLLNPIVEHCRYKSYP